MRQVSRTLAKEEISPKMEKGSKKNWPQWEKNKAFDSPANSHRWTKVTKEESLPDT